MKKSNFKEMSWLQWVLIWISWLCAALFFSSQALFDESSFTSVSWETFRNELIFFHLWFVLTPVILWLDARFKILSNRLTNRLFFHAVAGLFIAFLHIILYCAAIQFLGLSATPRTFFNRLGSYLKLFYHLDVICYLAVFGTNYAIDYYRRYREEELRSTRLEAKFAQTQLQMLKMQLHPHFLFNTLNAVSVLMTKDVKAAKKMLVSLSDLLRKSLEDVEADEVTLEQELEFLEHYLKIEVIRFQNRLTIKIDVEPQALDAQVPNLILQPLVENAIRHGIAARIMGGTIEICGKREEKLLRLSVRDTGRKFDAEKPGEIKEGIGLSNTQARLKQLYGDDFSFQAKYIEDGFLADITIPFQTIRKSGMEVSKDN
ncbi:MAG: histidine kinase [Acidobacteria bacterium]|nr:histidine kinase [Acidobacteriota bacterium]